MRHHTKDKGDLGVLKAQVDLAQRGYTILYPLTEHADFDLVVYKDGTFLRVQVKYRSLSANGTLFIPFKTTWSDRNGIHEQQWSREHIDLCCVYCPETDECYYFNPSEYQKSISLRVEAPKNNQQKHVRLAADYRRIP